MCFTFFSDGKGEKMNKEKFHNILDSIKYTKIVNDKNKLHHAKIRLRYGRYTFENDEEKREYYRKTAIMDFEDKLIDASLNKTEKAIVFALSGFKNISELEIDE